MLTIYSLLAIVISLLSSLILLFRISKNHLLIQRSFFWHYTLGFFIFSLVHGIILFINSGMKVSYDFLLILYIVSFVALVFSYALFYRGTLLLFTKDKFLTTIMPLIVFPLFAALTHILFSVFKIEAFIMYTAVSWGFLFSIEAFLGILFLYFFINGAPLDTKKRQLYAFLLSSAWFLILALDVILWFRVAIYPSQFWILKIAGSKKWLILRSFAYLLILIGSLIYGRRLKPSQATEKE